jgi:hypothetical protein
MIAMRITKMCLLCTAVYVAFALAMNVPVASSAQTPIPWWGLTSEARPTNLQAGEGRDEVQELTVSATKGEVFLVAEGKFTLAPYNATAQQIQEAVETLYPSRKVVVTGGPGDEEGSKPYLITFPDQSVAEPIFASGEAAKSFGGEALSCEGATGSHCTAEANVTEVAKGKVGADVTVVAENLGDASVSGESTPVSIADKLPAGLEAVAIEGLSGDNYEKDRGPVECSLSALTCTFSGTLPAYEVISVHVGVAIRPGASSGEENEAVVSGGGAPTKKVSKAIDIGGHESFGIEDYSLTPENVGGLLDTQAGSHPFQLTSVITINHEETLYGPQPVALPKDIVSELPVGLVGNPTPFNQCTDREFEERPEREGLSGINGCPSQSAIGVATVTYRLPGPFFLLEASTIPIFNMTPLGGEPARFAFEVTGVVPVFLDTSVRTGRDYGVTVSANNITQAANLLSVRLTFWGVPGDSSHDSDRGWACVENVGQCPSSTNTNPPPFLIMPSSCEQPYESTLTSDSWAAGTIPSYHASPVTYHLPEALTGCNHLPFAPSIAVAPDVSSASTASGLTVDVHTPQEAALNPEGLTESTLRNTTVTLPAGVTLNPAGADGLEACSENQIGFLPGESSGDELHFTPDRPSCPDASKIGTVKIKTPLLPNPLEGEVYLATQNANPFGSLIAMYIVAEDPVSGVLVKLPGKVVPDPVTGQLVSTFKNTPQLPFEDLELHFFGGARAPLSTPALCGSYETNALFGPWSGEASVNTSASFQITTGPNGGPCTNPLPFAPSLTAGTTSIQAGGFSPFTMTMSRPDGSQNLQAVQLKMPPGLLGTLATVKLCKEAQANAGTCGPESLIGHTTVSVGVGGNPYSVTGGEVFITEGYAGAPYGLSIVNPAKAGPFDLGKVIVRAKIEVDPITAVLTITTDTSGPYKIPTILDGIPLQIQHINVAIDRPNFTFNPTNCSQLPVTGSLTSDQGATKALSVPFQVTNCAVLAFKPKLTAKVSGKTSRANGASLSVKLTYPAGPYDANIAKVKVDLPRQLPSQLRTLQQACLAATFNANPAACPPASIVGHATATTPVLPVPLTGPAYFVSHGDEQFPDLVIVLQGYGTTVHLVGSTFINKANITSSTFKSIPDVPVGTFELTLPQGKYSALAANGNLCTTKKLAMPTSFVAQNGVVINTSTPIAPTGCAKHKAKKATKKTRHHATKTHGKKK